MTETAFAGIRRVFRALPEAIQEGSNVQGRLVWTIFDNSERVPVHSRRSVIGQVGGEPPQRIRGQSADWHRDVIAKNGLAI